jgi:Domain of unknown function (DUF4157)
MAEPTAAKTEKQQAHGAPLNRVPRHPSVTASSMADDHVRIISLQRDAGNQAVGRLLTHGDRKQSVQSALGSNGRPLDTAIRTLMESRFGYDFGAVRVHAGQVAAESAQKVKASAYTVGHHIVFAEGKHAPHTPDGEKRLAHELAHVVQQSTTTVTGVTAADGLRISEPGDHFEQAAEQTAQRVTSSSQPVLGRTHFRNLSGEHSQPTVIQRDPPTDAEQRYNLRIGQETLQGATRDQVIAALRRYQRRLRNSVDSDEERYRLQRALREDQWIVGAIADFAGGVELPPRDFMSTSRVTLNAVDATLSRGDIELSIRGLQQADQFWRAAHRLLYDYIEGTISGAETTVTALEVTAAAGAVAATVVTGGVAAEAGLGLLGTSAAVGGVAGGYGATQEYAGQVGEVLTGTRRDFDVGAILRRGATDAVIGFVGALAGGALSRYATRFFGSYLSNISNEALVELGEHLGMRGALPRDFFLTNGQRFIADFLGGAGATPLTVAVGNVMRRLTGGGPLPNAEEFARQVIDEMVRGGAIQVFLGAITHGRGGSARSGSRGSTPPESPPPSPVSRSAGEPTSSARPAPRAAEANSTAPVQPPSGQRTVTPAASGEASGRMRQVIPISEARPRSSSSRLRPGPREVTSIDTARQRRQAASRPSESQSQAQPQEQAQPAEFRQAAGAELTSVQGAQTPRSTSSREPMLAMAGTRRPSSRPQEQAARAAEGPAPGRAGSRRGSTRSRGSDPSTPRLEPEEAPRRPTVAEVTQEPRTTGQVVEELERTARGGRLSDPAEQRLAAQAGTEIEPGEIVSWGRQLGTNFEVIPRQQFPAWLARIFRGQQRPDMVAINQSQRTIIVGDVTSAPGTTVPERFARQETRLHIEKTIEDAQRLRDNLPPEFREFRVFAQEWYWQLGGQRSRLIPIR